jgi:toxin CptA
MIIAWASALLASVMNSLPVALKITLFIAIAIYGYFEFKRLRTLQHCLEHTETGWRLASGNEFTEIKILPSTVLSIVAIFLHFKPENQPEQSLLIFRDVLDEDDYRQLTVRLKITVSSDKDKS